MKPATLQTSRLLLRPWRDADLPDFAALNADPRVMEFMPAMLTRAESDSAAAALRDHFARHGFGRWAVEIPGISDFIGFVGLHHVAFTAPFTPCVEIAWRLAAPHWGQGYATEAAQAALAFAFETLQLDEVVAFTVPTNTRSRRVMERLGMTRNPGEDFEHPKLPPGHPLRHHVLYRCTRPA
ncbi:MAG TPA: GNAT family N-acetyltransferase [Phycisphaerae bacterium]|nr:GNAT family N-acetyltransferase [Phycisphaerales bacterium]HRX86853.1 GNAT family N-acetyltransferase [Phycisphaerae bacterium]